MNIWCGTGNLVKDTEIKYTPNGKAVLNNTIAVQRNYKNEKGEYESDFINFVIFGKSAEFLANYGKKGDKIGITGRIQTRNYNDKDGKKVYVTEIIADSVELLSNRKKEVEVPAGSIKAEEIDAVPIPNDPFDEQMTITEDTWEPPF